MPETFSSQSVAYQAGGCFLWLFLVTTMPSNLVQHSRIATLNGLSIGTSIGGANGVQPMLIRNDFIPPGIPKSVIEWLAKALRVLLE